MDETPSISPKRLHVTSFSIIQIFSAFATGVVHVLEAQGSNLSSVRDEQLRSVQRNLASLGIPGKLNHLSSYNALHYATHFLMTVTSYLAAKPDASAAAVRASHTAKALSSLSNQ